MKKILLVGGSVRDSILGQKPKDKDYIAVGYTEDELAVMPGARKIGKAFPVFLIPGYGEVALARKEKVLSVKDAGYNPEDPHNNFTVDCKDISLEEDLLRRDLTCNAIAMDEETGDLFDPYGGVKDLKKGILRHVSNAFSEDPLRVYRLARFFCQSWAKEVAGETKELISEIPRTELLKLSVERVVGEWLRAMGSERPQNFISLLDELRLLHVHFPELSALKGIPAGPEQHHKEKDSLVHTIMVLMEASKLTKDPIVRVAALLHDLGKAVTEKELLPSHPKHEEAGVEIISKMGRRLKMPRDYIDAAKLASKEHLRVHRCADMAKVKVVDIVQDAKKSKLGVEGLAIIAKADGLGRIPSKSGEGPGLLLKAAEALKSFKSLAIPPQLQGKEKGLWVRMKMGEHLSDFLRK